ncbi:hypothetical protein [Flavobacterium sp. 9]|uniref:hypothetical protein n=1 Tax=Flavobacterium sp. 9 TaxID=2035198 RepID=UPI000C1A1F18|nr:hypothetical protein [Flavobacterium sp. 9]
MNKISYFRKKIFMLKNFVKLILLSSIIISCKENNNSLPIEKMGATKPDSIGLVANIDGANIYDKDTLTLEKIGKLKYAEKANTINFHKNQTFIKINFKGKDAYISKKDVEIISPEIYKKSYFAKDCYCLLGSDKIRTINFPTPYDTIHFLFNNNQITMVQQILYYRTDKNVKEIQNDLKKLKYSTVYKYINKDNFYSSEIIDPNKKESFLDCYNSKTNYTIKENKPVLSSNYDDVVYELYFAQNLFNLDVCYAKGNYENFVKPLTNFDFKSQNLIIEQDKSQINKDVSIKLYEINTYKPIAYNKNYISFNYLREIKMIEKDGQKKYFAKINVLENEGSSLAGEYYIVLNEVAMFASISN